MSAAILGLLTALPQLLTMINNIAAWINKVSGNDPAGFAAKVADAFSQLNNAKTPDENSAAAKALADLIGGMSK
jgi:hypothetical protein